MTPAVDAVAVKKHPLDGRHVGFTGTRQGMTSAQAEVVATLLKAGVLHHGDCVGADAQAHAIARENGLGVVIHPPTSTSLRAFCKGDLSWPLKPYLQRNRDIVDSTQELVATPAGPEEQRSGTWSTIRYARKRGKPVTVVYPDGVVTRW